MRETGPLRMRLLPLLLVLALPLTSCGDGDATTNAPSEVDLLAYGVSQIFIAVEKERPDRQAETLIRQAARALAKGESFGAVARARSDHQSAPDGGFLGFVNAHAETAFSGAVQATPPGEISEPIKTRYGWHIVKRHGFEEARRLEQELRVPTYGVVVGWDNPDNPMAARTGRTKPQAAALAQELIQGLANGTVSLEQAMAKYTPKQSQTRGAYLGLTERHGDNLRIFEDLRAAEPGQLLGPYDTPKGFAVVMRGRYLRSLFRHILIQHVGSQDLESRITRTPEQALVLAKEVLAKALADRGAWDDLVAAHSDDRYSRPYRGRMGVLHTGHMPEGFESFVFKQPADTIHPQVVESPFGFHIVWKVN